MDYQMLFNIAIGLVGTLGGWFLKSLGDSLKSLQMADSMLTDKVQKIELMVAGEYVKNTELEKLGNAIFVKLDKIENKLDGKADK